MSNNVYNLIHDLAEVAAQAQKRP